MLRWLDETNHKASRISELNHSSWLDRHLGGMVLAEISLNTINALTKIRQAELVVAATVDRMFAVVRTIFRKAALEWE